MEPSRRIRRVVAIATTFPGAPGDGTPEFVLTLSDALPVDDVTIVAPAVAGAARSERVGHVDIRRFRYSLLGREALTTDAILPALRARPLLVTQVPGLLIGLILTTLHELKRRPAELVHAHWLIPGGLVARIANQINGTPYVVTAHGADVYALQGRIGTALKRWVMRRALAVYPVSRDISRRLEAIHPSTVGEVLPMGVRVSELQAAGEDHDRLTDRLLVVGRLADKKGVDVALRALSMLKSPCHLHVIGDGPDREQLESLAIDLGVADRVTFLGKRPRQEVIVEQRRAAIVLIPSIEGSGGDRDGTPVVLVEAMTLSAPLIGSSIGGIAEHLRHGETGILTPPGDAKALAGAIDALLTRPERASELGQAAARYAAENFDVRVLAERLMTSVEARLADS